MRNLIKIPTLYQQEERKLDKIILAVLSLIAVVVSEVLTDGED